MRIGDPRRCPPVRGRRDGGGGEEGVHPRRPARRGGRRRGRRLAHWGAAAPPRDDGQPPDLAGMDPAALQAELLRRHAGPSFGFVKLRLGVRRSQEEVMGIATRWTNVLRTGSVAAKFVAVDFGTLMFTMDTGQDILEVKEFILSQPEAYEFKIGNQAFRRPGDPPLDEVVEMLQKQKSTMLSQDPGSQQYKSKVEL